MNAFGDIVEQFSPWAGKETNESTHFDAHNLVFHIEGMFENWKKCNISSWFEDPIVRLVQTTLDEQIVDSLLKELFLAILETMENIVKVLQDLVHRQ